MSSLQPAGGGGSPLPEVITLSTPGGEENSMGLISAAIVIFVVVVLVLAIIGWVVVQKRKQAEKSPGMAAAAGSGKTPTTTTPATGGTGAGTTDTGTPSPAGGAPKSSVPGAVGSKGPAAAKANSGKVPLEKTERTPSKVK